MAQQVNKLDNLSNVFSTNIRISHADALKDQSLVFPHNTEICITRLPVRARDGYTTDNMKGFATKLKASMSKNGIVFLICYPPTEDKSRPFEIINLMKDAGFNHIDNIIVERTWLPGKRSENTLVTAYDMVLYFCNGDVWTIDREPIREFMLIEREDSSCPGNLWCVETGSLEESISHDLAEILIRMTGCLPGSVIFDAFMSNKATLETALKLGHSFHGFEQDKSRMKIYDNIVSKYKNY